MCFERSLLFFLHQNFPFLLPNFLVNPLEQNLQNKQCSVLCTLPEGSLNGLARLNYAVKDIHKHFCKYLARKLKGERAGEINRTGKERKFFRARLAVP